MIPAVDYDLRQCPIGVVRDLCAAHHGYGGAGAASVYAFAVYEGGIPVAGFSWQPPPPGAARAVCPEMPSAVLSLSRMVAIPRAERKLNHISRPLKRQMRWLIDRSRWPVLVTYHDVGQGHSGHVYKCSGWRETSQSRRPFYVDDSGARISSYANGVSSSKRGTRGGYTEIHRWEHWACERGMADRHLLQAGWVRVKIPGKFWASGAQAYKLVRLES